MTNSREAEAYRAILNGAVMIGIIVRMVNMDRREREALDAHITRDPNELELPEEPQCSILGQHRQADCNGAHYEIIGREEND